MNIKRLCINIICGFIPGEKMRRRVRVMLNHPSARSYIKFVQKWADENCGGARKITLNFGVGCQNLIVTLNDTHVFKFAFSNNGNSVADRELRICDALRTVSPIRIPEMELISWRGMVVRRYEFVRGKLLCEFSPSYVWPRRIKLARQLAEFMYAIGRTNPSSIRDLKPTKSARPGYMYGWFHNDIGQNFLMDDDLNIIGFIDWEGAAFCDWRSSLYAAERFWNKNGYKGLMTDVLAEYSRLYYADKAVVKK